MSAAKHQSREVRSRSSEGKGETRCLRSSPLAKTPKPAAAWRLSVGGTVSAARVGPGPGFGVVLFSVIQPSNRSSVRNVCIFWSAFTVCTSSASELILTKIQAFVGFPISLYMNIKYASRQWFLLEPAYLIQIWIITSLYYHRIFFEMQMEVWKGILTSFNPPVLIHCTVCG